MTYCITKQFEATCDGCDWIEVWQASSAVEGKDYAREDGWSFSAGGERSARVTCPNCRKRAPTPPTPEHDRDD